MVNRWSSPNTSADFAAEFADQSAVVQSGANFLNGHFRPSMSPP
jgi:hypothetical protein